MLTWVVIGVVGVVVGYVLARAFRPTVAERVALEPIVITLNSDLSYGGTRPETKAVNRGDSIVWEVRILGSGSAEADVAVVFGPDDSPSTKNKVQSGKGNLFFGDRAKPDAKKKDYKYAIEVNERQVADPVIRIR